MTPRGSVHLPHGQVEVECGRVVSVACGTYFWEKCQSVQYIGDILGWEPHLCSFHFCNTGINSKACAY